MQNEQESNQVLCKDCRHSFQLWQDKIFFNSKRYTLKCRKNYKNDTEEEDLVTGPKKKPAHYESCSLTRLDSQPCGTKGKLWQPKDKNKLFFYMKRV